MKTHRYEKVAVITAVLMTALIILSGCTRAIQAAELERNLYHIEEEKIIIYLEEVEELSEAGGWINIPSGDISNGLADELSRTLIIVCTGEEKYIAASRCNHKGWVLTYDEEEKIFISSDGKRKFNLDGSAIGDQPKKDLDICPYIIKDGYLVIDL